MNRPAPVTLDERDVTAQVKSRQARGALLGHGPYSTLVTSRGTGASAFDGHALNRWAGDRSADADGFFLYLKDRESGALWSAGLSPVPVRTGEAQSSWSPGVFTLEREEHGIGTRVEIAVVPGLALEVRRVTMTNHGDRPRTIDLASALEVVLHRRKADLGHPAFSRLFIQTAWDASHGALVARRRPRDAGERFPVMVHALLEDRGPEYESDRARFLGRVAARDRPAALVADLPLSKGVGNVLDPVFALRTALVLAPGESVARSFVLAAAWEVSDALAALESARSAGGAALVALAREHAFGRLLRFGVTAEEAEESEAAAIALAYGEPWLRARRGSAAGSRTALERFGVTPGRATVVIHALPGAETATQFRCLRYLRALDLDLGAVLILTGEPESRPPDLGPLDGLPYVVVRAADLAPGELAAVERAADWIVDGAGAPRPSAPAARARAVAPETIPVTLSQSTDAEPAPAPLAFWNGYGGFADDGRTYVIRMPRGEGGTLQKPPLPWVNVIANETFGFLVSETGAGPTWSQNSRERRLTPWSNDPLLDPHGEALFVKDEESGTVLSPWPGPAPGEGAYETRHGFGVTRCTHESAGLTFESEVFVPRHDPVKITRVTITNRGDAPRRLSFVAYRRLVLGVTAEETARGIVTARDAASGALFASNADDPVFGARVAFAALIAPEVRVTCDRAAFLGAEGSLARPHALDDDALFDGRTGADLDPCFAERAAFTLAPGERRTLLSLFGDGADRDDARVLVERHRLPGAADTALEEVRRFWERLVSGVQVETPSPALDPLVNGWLAYQTLACRIWGRTAFYQSGGAFGFRDQLQDASALLHFAPHVFREQIVLNAAHQFTEGDVMHWWHPPLGQGLRTRFADDLLWLPWLTATYVGATGDSGVLDEVAGYLTARPLEEGEDEVFLTPDASGERGTVYEHGCRAIDRSLDVGMGAHGLPLFGSGDWNDGMNRVGQGGRGESVWMAFFLCTVIADFVPLCEARGDNARVLRYRAARAWLVAALETAGWDGAWYRRGYFDDGTPLGSAQSVECRIDALAQAWAVLSGAVPRARAEQAMDEVERQLVSDADGLVRLLTPPFERSTHDPGYIQGYVPGVRENGGQYTHAAMWVVRALAELGRRDRAAHLLELLSPVAHAQSAAQVALYQVEPYVVAADVYGAAPHVGRGGWTWYTGSAGWMLRVALESVLGVTVVQGRELVISPCVPDDWSGFRVTRRFEELRELRRRLAGLEAAAGGAGQRKP